jgi:DNA polymerase-1
MIMQVHDELVLETLSTEIDTVAQTVSRMMSEAAELSVPLVVECGIGDNWEAAH